MAQSNPRTESITKINLQYLLAKLLGTVMLAVHEINTDQNTDYTMRLVWWAIRRAWQ